MQKLRKRINPFAEKKENVAVPTAEVEQPTEKINFNENTGEVIQEFVQQPVEHTTTHDLFMKKNEPEVQQKPIFGFNQQPSYEKPTFVQPQTKNVNNSKRIKYTSTMEEQIRRVIKITCAEKGIMFADFIEQACIEKLKREGLM